MPLQSITLPPNTNTVVHRYLAARLPVPRSAEVLSPNKPPLQLGKVALKLPHAVYELRLDEVAAGGGLETARHRFYRSIVYVAGEPELAIEVPVDPSGKTRRISSSSVGPLIKATADAFTLMAADDRVKVDPYTVRLLRFHALHILALWLKPGAGDDDIICPLLPLPGGLEAQTPYTVNEFWASVRPIAERRMANWLKRQHDQPPGPATI